MNLWRWLTTPDPAPGLTTTKLLKLAIRVMLFALMASLVSACLQLTPLRPYLKTGWGSMLLVFALYLPCIKFFNIDTFTNRTPPPVNQRPGTAATLTPAQRRKEKNRFAGVKKAPPKYGGRR
ncbi:hypothetical protein [Deinococcus sp.]|uniref:hypothetical protein n=1 Tax=Deinococcus sp. TaxID=47478 RepID=UPI0025C4E9AC|nr:hypothetical protein [Deinococcus sp.]